LTSDLEYAIADAQIERFVGGLQHRLHLTSILLHQRDDEVRLRCGRSTLFAARLAGFLGLLLLLLNDNTVLWIGPDAVCVKETKNYGVKIRLK
jgi:hypothetical protein